MAESTGGKKRVRKNPEERRREIAEAAAKLIGERGSNAVSIRDVADEVGMSHSGLLHYIGDKNGLIRMVIDDVYAGGGTVDDFLRSGLPGSDPEGPLFPAYLRFLVRHNAQRRSMVRLFSVLSVESLSVSHPLHEDFERRFDDIWQDYLPFPWRIPPQVGDWGTVMRPRVRLCMETMDGIQLRWLRDSPIDLYDEWLQFESIMFPSPLWDGYK